MASKRLTPDSWLLAGFKALAEHGPVALKAEPLARMVGTTKGSFYWHFADVPAFHAALMDKWRDAAIKAIEGALAEGGSPAQSLRHLAETITTGADEALGGATVEPALRAWARSDANVADMLARIDALRIAHLNKLLVEIGIINPEMAKLIYGAAIGLEDMDAGDEDGNQNALGTLVDLVLALRD